MIIEVCEGVDHCRYMEMAVEMTVRWRRWRQQGAQGGGGAGSSFPVADIMGERRPLALFLHGFLGALPNGDEIHGGGKNVALEAVNSWVETALHELGFPPLYRLPDFRQPSRVAVNRAYLGRPDFDWADLGLKISVWKIVITFLVSRFLLDAVFEGETDNIRKKFSDGLQKSPNSTPTRFPLIFLIIHTHQSVKQEHCALLQLLVG